MLTRKSRNFLKCVRSLNFFLYFSVQKVNVAPLLKFLQETKTHFSLYTKLVFCPKSLFVVSISSGTQFCFFCFVFFLAYVSGVNIGHHMTCVSVRAYNIFVGVYFLQTQISTLFFPFTSLTDACFFL